MLTPNLRKEFRTAAVPWAVTFAWLTVWYLPQYVAQTQPWFWVMEGESYPFLNLLTLVGIPVMLQLLSVGLFTGEFVWGTMPQLLASPVPRSALWRDKVTVQFVCLGSIYMIPATGWLLDVELTGFRSEFGPEWKTLPLIGVPVLTSACIVPYIALQLRGYVAPVLAGLMTAPFLAIVFGLALDILNKTLFRGSQLTQDHGATEWGWRIYGVILFIVCGLTFWLGRRLFLNLEIAPTPPLEIKLGIRLGGVLRAAAAPGKAGTAAPTLRLPRIALPFWKEWRQLRPLGFTGIAITAAWMLLQFGTMLLIRSLGPSVVPYYATFLVFFCGFYVILCALASQGFASEYEDGTLSFLLSQPSRRGIHFVRKLAASGLWLALVVGLAWGGGHLLVILQQYPLFHISATHMHLTVQNVNDIGVATGIITLFLYCTAPLVSLLVRGRAVIFLVPFTPLAAMALWLAAEELFHLSRFLPMRFATADDFNTLPFFLVMAGALLAAWRRFGCMTVK